MAGLRLAKHPCPDVWRQSALIALGKSAVLAVEAVVADVGLARRKQCVVLQELYLVSFMRQLWNGALGCQKKCVAGAV